MTEQRFHIYRQAVLNRLIAHAVCCGDRLSWQLLNRAVQGRATLADRLTILTMSPNDPDYHTRSARAARRLFAHEGLGSAYRNYLSPVAKLDQ